MPLFRTDFPFRLAIALAVAPVFAQLDLGQVRLQPVRRADAGLVALPSFDSVGLDVRVDNGIARTRVTLVWTASAGLKRRYHWTCHAPEPETTFVSENSWLSSSADLYHDTTIVYRSFSRNSTTGAIDTSVSYSNQRTTTCRMTDITWVENRIDSIELTANFSLPADAAVTDLGLWVGDQRQSAWLMDRSKAAAQYNSIVGVRRDPALLESNGNGYYSLRVFPQSTGETRRLEFEVIQAWRKDVVLPVRYASSPSVPTSVWNGTTYVSGGRYAPNPRVVAISLASLDGSQVSIDLGTDGMLTAGAAAQTRVLASKETFQAVASGGTRDVWSAVRDGRPAFGSRVVFRGSEFTVAPEPRERVVFLEAIHGVERARRLALLALMQYGTRDGNRVNLLWRDREGGIKRLWKEPRSFTPEAALDAVFALKAWIPSDSVSPLASLRQLLATDSGRVVVHISDVARDVFPETIQPAWGTVAYQDYQNRLSGFNRAREDAWKALGDSLHARGMKLFGWWNDYQASIAAAATGGYSFGALGSSNWGRWRTGDSLVVPELFGPTRRSWNEGFQGMNLARSGMAVDSFASDLASPRSVYVGVPILIEPRTISVAYRRASASSLLAARAAAPSLPESLVVTLAGRHGGAGTLELQMRCFWGGLDATAKRTLQVTASGGAAGASVWAREYASMLQPWIWARDTITDAVRTMGRSYRIATSATSFLALEPGVAPFDSVGGQGESDITATSSEKSSMVVRDTWMADTLIAEGGSVLLDSLSLESLLLGRVLAVTPPPVSTPVFQGLKLVANGGLEILAGASSEAPRIHVLDVSGRELATPLMRRTEAGWSGNWKPATSSMVLVRMIQDGKVQVRRAFVQP